MKNPKLSNYKKSDEVWIATVEEDDFDIELPDENGLPDKQAYKTASLILEKFSSISLEAIEYLKEFCEKNNPFISKEGSTLLTLQVKSDNTITLYYNWDEDIYGQWFVSFSWNEFSNWKPVEFGRRNW